MSYNKEKDKIIEDIVIDGTSLHIQLTQYDGGEKKIAIVNEIPIKTSNGFDIGYTTKLKRMPISIAKKLTKTLSGFMEKIEG
ncbi:MAG: hypothetical protein GF383_16800 [Candidatus Lokiarchaeota archaeon]|nr:hypothetical protein [Candidatus Lokiarchaeota archaeon]